MNKAMLKDLHELVPEDKALSDEVEAIKRANKSIVENGTISHDAITWD